MVSTVNPWTPTVSAILIDNLIYIDQCLLSSADTWADGNHWTTVELNTGLICACLPALKAPMASFLRRLGIGSHVSTYPPDHMVSQPSHAINPAIKFRLRGSRSRLEMIAVRNTLWARMIGRYKLGIVELRRQQLLALHMTISSSRISRISLG